MSPEASLLSANMKGNYPKVDRWATFTYLAGWVMFSFVGRNRYAESERRIPSLMFFDGSLY